MTPYERRCRMLLRAFPEVYRTERGDEMVAVLLDMSGPGQRWPSFRTAADLLSAGLRVRSRLSSRGRASLAVVEGLRVAALLGLCVQAAFSVAMVAHYARDGMLFYLTNNAWSTASHGVLAAMWVLALLLVVTGRPRAAMVPALTGSAGAAILLVSAVVGGLGRSGPSEVLIAVQITLLALVPTLALLAASLRSVPKAGGRSMLWVVTSAGLAAVFSVMDTGVGTTAGGGRQLTFPPSSGLVSLLSALCVAALLVMLLASPFDPRLGVAMVVVSLPVVVYQVGMLLAVDQKPPRPVYLAVAALASAALVAFSSAISLRRLKA